MRDVKLYQLEAETLLSKADKRFKSRLFFLFGQRRLSSAAQNYCRAALLYYRGGNMDESRKAFLMACECYKKKKVWYSAAKALEQAMIISTQQNNFESLVELSWRTAALYDMARQPDHAALILTRSGTILQFKDPEKFLIMMYKAAEIVAVENRYIQAASYLKRIALVHLNKNELPRAVPVLERIIDLYMQTDEHTNLWQSVVNLTLLLLILEEYDRVKYLLHEYSIVKGIDPKELKVLNEIVDAFHNPDNCDKVNKGLKALEYHGILRSFFKYDSVIEKLKGLSITCKAVDDPEEGDSVSLSLSERSKISITYSLSQPDVVIMKENRYLKEDPGITTNLIHPSMNPNTSQFDAHPSPKKLPFFKDKFQRSISAYGN